MKRLDCLSFIACLILFCVSFFARADTVNLVPGAKSLNIVGTLDGLATTLHRHDAYSLICPEKGAHGEQVYGYVKIADTTSQANITTPLTLVAQFNSKFTHTLTSLTSGVMSGYISPLGNDLFDITVASLRPTLASYTVNFICQYIDTTVTPAVAVNMTMSLMPVGSFILDPTKGYVYVQTKDNSNK